MVDLFVLHQKHFIDQNQFVSEKIEKTAEIGLKNSSPFSSFKTANFVRISMKPGEMVGLFVLHQKYFID